MRALPRRPAVWRESTAVGTTLRAPHTRVGAAPFQMSKHESMLPSKHQYLVRIPSVFVQSQTSTGQEKRASKCNGFAEGGYAGNETGACKVRTRTLNSRSQSTIFLKAMHLAYNQAFALYEKNGAGFSSLEADGSHLLPVPRHHALTYLHLHCRLVNLQNHISKMSALFTKLL